MKNAVIVVAALEKLTGSGTIQEGERVVVVSTAHGLKFADTKVAYHRGGLDGLASPLANPPVETAPTLEAILGVLDERLGVRPG